MKINKINIKNILGIQEINFEPGNINLIQGESGSGKTSILEALQRAITGKSERNCFVNTTIDSKGEVYLLIDDNINLKKKFDKNGKTSTKLTKDDISIPSPGTYIKGLINELQLNPIDLIKMEDKELTELILSLIKIKVPDEIINKLGMNIDNDRHGLKVCEEIENTLYEKRGDINREIKLMEGEIEGYKEKLPSMYDVTYAKTIDLKEIFDEISKSNRINVALERAKNIINEKENKIKSINEKSEIEINNLLEKIEGIKERTIKEIEKEHDTAANAEKYIEDNKEINIVELENVYKEKDNYKSFIPIAEELCNKRNLSQIKKEEAIELTQKIDLIRKLPAELLSNSEMPIDNLEYKDGKININGRPIINLSGGERIKFVMDIVKKVSGDLKLILINGFESLNENEQFNFIENCKDDGFQYFITKTCDSELTITNADTGEIF